MGTEQHHLQLHMPIMYDGNYDFVSLICTFTVLVNDPVCWVEGCSDYQVANMKGIACGARGIQIWDVLS